MACQWQKICDRAPFAGRCAHVGDTWGATDNAHYTLRNLAYLAHLLEKRYPPYTKWLGTSLSELSVGNQLAQINEQVLRAQDWSTKEDAVLRAYTLIGELHNSINTLPRISLDEITFHGRPYRMIDIDAAVRTLKDKIEDPKIKELSLSECAVWQLAEYDTALCRVEFMKAYRAILKSGALH